MANGDLHPCEACGGDGFEVKRCGCREACCPHVSFRGSDSDERPGLYQKFWVRRTDGSSGEGGKHADCAYLVLDWTHDPFAKVAALAYADACEATRPELAMDLRAKARKNERTAMNKHVFDEAVMKRLRAPFGCELIPGTTPDQRGRWRIHDANDDAVASVSGLEEGYARLIVVALNGHFQLQKVTAAMQADMERSEAERESRKRR